MEDTEETTEPDTADETIDEMSELVLPDAPAREAPLHGRSAPKIHSADRPKIRSSFSRRVFMFVLFLGFIGGGIALGWYAYDDLQGEEPPAVTIPLNDEG